MATLMGTFAGGLAAFHADMFSTNGRNVLLVAQSEFGRRLTENGSLGTDHGHGNVMLLLGNHVAGGRVLAQWPGLDPQQLFESKDLQVTIDFRDVLAEVVQQRLANTNLAYVFPGYTPTFPGVIRPAYKADFNCDGHVDADDLATFNACASGPAIPHSSDPACTAADFDGDNDVDQADFGQLQRCLAGQRLPTDTACAN
jgi:hypothetical protein